MNDPVIAVAPLAFPWQTRDPFLMCVHHFDDYPSGNENLGPAVSLAGRNIGSDFEGKKGFRMYHGEVVPGFPQHPHRGFETVTLVRQGFVDHWDSLGATARFGPGDAQWLTAGKGILHCEMFPLLNADNKNPLELFQIWLNLPRKAKLVDPHFSMFWEEAIPTLQTRDLGGRTIQVTTIAGKLADMPLPAPPAHSWASNAGAEVAIWTIKLSPHAEWLLPPATKQVYRTLYFFRGDSMKVAGRLVGPRSVIALKAEAPTRLENGPAEGELLLLQGRPIGEPVAQHGPFVMNTRAELDQAFEDYHRTKFGGWPWPSNEPVHSRSEGRFARHPDGRLERPR